MNVMRIYHRRKSSRKYSIDIYDHNGARWRFTGLADKSQTLKLAAKYRRLFDAWAQGADPDVDLLGWIDRLSAETQQKFIQAGVISTRVAARTTPVVSMLNTWDQPRVDLGVNDAGKSKKRLIRLFEACGFENLTDLDSDRIISQLGEWRRRTKKPIGVTTTNHYITAAIAFSYWAAHPKRAGKDLLPGLEKMKSGADDLLINRHALTMDEQRALLATTRASGVDFELTGEERWLVYFTVLRTGLRSGELCAARRSHYNGKSIEVVGKNGEKVNQPVGSDLAVALNKRVLRLLPDAPLIKTPGYWDMAEMLHADLKRAGITPPEGETIDFHALRTTFVTSLALAGVHVNTAKVLARHKTIRMTLEIYTKLGLTDNLDGLAKLPSLDPIEKKADQA